MKYLEKSLSRRSKKLEDSFSTRSDAKTVSSPQAGPLSPANQDQSLDESAPHESRAKVRGKTRSLGNEDGKEKSGTYYCI